MDLRRGATIAVGAILCLALGVVLGFFFDDENPTSPPKVSSQPTTAPVGPTREIRGVPIGYARTEDGAVSAAANFTLLTTRDDLDDREELGAALQTLAAPHWKEAARRQAENGIDFLKNRYGADADVSGAVLGYDVSDFGGDRAEVNLWTLSVASGSKRAQVDEVWSTITVNLIWANGDWRVIGNESSPGPQPVGLPIRDSSQDVFGLMRGLTEFERAPLP